MANILFVVGWSLSSADVLYIEEWISIPDSYASGSVKLIKRSFHRPQFLVSGILYSSWFFNTITCLNL
jgi:hypothetical protein